MVETAIGNSRLIAENTNKTLYKEIQKTWYDALSSKEKYEAGKSTVFEYNKIRMKLASRESEQTQSKYEYMLQQHVLDFYAGK